MTDSLRFWKMSGAGNDFIVIDADDGLVRPPGELARLLCPRRLGVGADGLLALRRVRGGVSVDYCNADGSHADFCGNGARCAARFAVDTGMSANPLRLEFARGEVHGRVEPGGVTLTVPMPRLLGTFSFADERLSGLRAVRVEAGVEHLVVDAAGSERVPAAAELRAALAAQDPGLSDIVNVTRAALNADGSLAVSTDERGCGETLACGSGALAAAVAVDPPRDGRERVVVPPAGIPLYVSLDDREQWASLRGQAALAYRGEIDDLSDWPR